MICNCPSKTGVSKICSTSKVVTCHPVHFAHPARLRGVSPEWYRRSWSSCQCWPSVSIAGVAARRGARPATARRPLLTGCLRVGSRRCWPRPWDRAKSGSHPTSWSVERRRVLMTNSHSFDDKQTCICVRLRHCHLTVHCT